MKDCSSIVFVSGTTSQTAATTAAQLTGFTGNGLNTNRYGDPSVIPDYANNRVKVNTPGLYRVIMSLQGLAGGTDIFTIQLRKNGLTTDGSKIAKLSIASGAYGVLFFAGLIEVTRADAQALTTALTTFANPSNNVTNMPEFSGAGGAPSTLTYFDLLLSSGSGTGITFQSGEFIVERIDE